MRLENSARYSASLKHFGDAVPEGTALIVRRHQLNRSHRRRTEAKFNRACNLLLLEDAWPHDGLVAAEQLEDSDPHGVYGDPVG